MSMPDYDWLELYPRDPVVLLLRITAGVIGATLLVVLLAFR